MWGTGLRLRFFSTIFIVLALTAASVSAIHFNFFKQERLRLIELNLEQNVSLLADSDLSLSKKEFSSLGHSFVNEVIGDDKVNMIVAIYNKSGSVLYKNENAEIFELEDKIDPSDLGWEDVEYNDYYIKFLTQTDSNNRRIIKVGMILNQSLLRWKDLNQRIFIFVGIILFIITLISFFLSYVLFKPMRALAEQVNLLGEKIENGNLDELKSWFNRLKFNSKRKDEFNSLLSSFDKLTKRIVTTQQMTQRWSALMAHELKTPLTRLRMTIEDLAHNSNIPSGKFKSVEEEMTTLEEIIMDFLEWASVENDPNKPEIHAVNIGKRTDQYLTTFKESHPHLQIKLQDETSPDFRVFCNPIHFDQVLSNLLSNAAKYGGNSLQIICSDGKISFADNGEGIPENVIENFGKPFNKHTRPGVTGHGLGLAWISTIANKYNWKINIDRSSGTKIEILFPPT